MQNPFMYPPKIGTATKEAPLVAVLGEDLQLACERAAGETAWTIAAFDGGGNELGRLASVLDWSAVPFAWATAVATALHLYGETHLELTESDRDRMLFNEPVPTLAAAK